MALPHSIHPVENQSGHRCERTCFPPEIFVHPGKMDTLNSNSWRFGSDDFPFQWGDV